jgi:hypothetical protein
MQIQLCEDDGEFFGGIPQLVVLVVEFDDGKKKRIPYQADKTIAALYQDLRSIAPQVTSTFAQDASSIALDVLDEPKLPLAVQQADKSHLNANKAPSTSSPEDKSNVIEKEDIVTLILLHERETTFSGMKCPLIVGMDYRVLEIFGPRVPINGVLKQMVNGYDVIDDGAATPERMRVFPDEVRLKSKRVLQGVEKVSTVEEVLPCPACQVNNSLALVGEEFKGSCSACKAEIIIARVITDCQNPKCKKNKVSCFDVGGKYEGNCNKCESTIEVPYGN